MASAAADPNEHTIASYNMSWANSAGFHTKGDSEILLDEADKPVRTRVTEYFFIKRAKEARQFWNKALKHLNDFVVAKNPSFIGIQEAGRIKDFKKLPCFETEGYHINESKQRFETLHTIWRKDLGEPIEIMEEDSGIEFGEVGRPIVGIYTSNGFLLVNCHLPWGEDKGSKDKWFKKAQQEYLSTFLQPFFDKYLINLSKLFIVGDFNYESYLASNPLQLRQVTLTGGNRAPAASCCHTDSRQQIAAYVRGNDYCFGLNVVEELKVLPSPIDETGEFGMPGGSVASDHELVYATFKSSSVAGGSRRSKRSLLRSRGSRRVRRMTKKRSRPFKNRCHRIIRQIH